MMIELIETILGMVLGATVLILILYSNGMMIEPDYAIVVYVGENGS